ncbi:MAG: ABC transporter permease [Raoultibacter sp.]
MRSLFAVARRVLAQFRHDPRTIAIMILAPCLALWLFSVLLGSGEYRPRIVTLDLPSQIEKALEDQDVDLVDVDKTQAAELHSHNEIDAIVSHSDSTLLIHVEGADASKTGSTVKQIQAALVEAQKNAAAELETEVEAVTFELPNEILSQLPSSMQETIKKALNGVTLPFSDLSELMPITDMEVSYLHGSKDWTSFDFFGPVFIGIFIFVFVFLTSSMSLLTERSGGTVARLLATPAKGWQIVGGYVLGFGLVALVQSVIILWASIALIGFPNEGSLLLVGFITISMAIVSLTLGLLISGLAHTPFQVVQLMIVFVVPQILLSGIFDLSQAPEWMQVLAQAFPIYYGADALRDVMLRGAGFADVAVNLAIIGGFAVLFFGLACLTFKKKRARKAQ